MDQVNPEHVEKSREYSKGYAAGKRKVDADTLELRRQIRVLEEDRERIRNERIYFECLRIVLQDCTGWEMDKKPINNAERYSNLAGIFRDHAIKRIPG